MNEGYNDTTPTKPTPEPTKFFDVWVQDMGMISVLAESQEELVERVRIAGVVGLTDTQFLALTVQRRAKKVFKEDTGLATMNLYLQPRFVIMVGPETAVAASAHPPGASELTPEQAAKLLGGLGGAGEAEGATA
jgi:hypothetical protein